LVNLVVAFETQGCDTVVCCLDTPALTVTHLIGVGGDNCTVLRPALLAGGFPYNLQKLVISVGHASS
jgi:hypothetical protein